MDTLLNDTRAWTIGVSCLVGLIMGGLAVGIALVGLYQRQRAAASQQWPSATGTVLSTTVRRYGGESSDYYWPDVNYQYTVAGQTYLANRYTIGPPSPFGSMSLQTAQARYPVGQPVAVYYNPRNPAEAVLVQREFSSRNYFMIAFVVLLLAVCLPPLFALASLSALGQ